MFDFDLAELYQVPTKRLNEQVRRNIDRFPEDFMFQVTELELEKTVEAFAESYKASAQLAGNTGPIRPAPIKPPSPNPGVIRIEGLDEGTREIPYGDGQH